VGVDGDFNVARWRGGSALLNQRVCCLRAEERTLRRRFLYYCLPYPLKALNDVTYWTAVKHLSSLDLLRFRFNLPPVEEQLVIERFLDNETAKIDDLISKKRTLIERLQEKRRTLISRVVTRGLPPDAARAAGLNPQLKLKPSDIDWIGEIPEHWSVSLLRRVADRIQTGGTPPTTQTEYYEDGTVSWFGPGSFNHQLVLTEPV
jgi:type I restriction enzyme S subunit